MDKVYAPDVIGILRAQPDDGTVFVIKSFALPVALWKLQSFLTPDAFYSLVIDLPALDTEQFCNLAITVATILASQLDHIGNKAFFILAAPCYMTLRGAVLTKYATGSAFRNAQLITNLINALTTTCGAQKFPRAASASICLSNVRSATARRN